MVQGGAQEERFEVKIQIVGSKGITGYGDTGEDLLGRSE